MFTLSVMPFMHLTTDIIYLTKFILIQLGREYVKAIYCHPAYFTYMQSISCEMLDWINHKLESRLLGEISTT